MRKLFALVAALALVAVVAGPAMAFTVNRAHVDNTTTAISNTGVTVGNVATVEKGFVGHEVEVGGANYVSNIRTGSADATALGVVAANTQIGCDWCGGYGLRINRASVTNVTGAQADSGVRVGGGVSLVHAGTGEVEVEGTNSVNSVTTGPANANSYGVVLVNTSWTGWLD